MFGFNILDREEDVGLGARISGWFANLFQTQIDSQSANIDDVVVLLLFDFHLLQHRYNGFSLGKLQWFRFMLPLSTRRIPATSAG